MKRKINKRKSKRTKTETAKILTGILKSYPRGHSFLCSEKGEYPDVYISSGKTGGALHGDMVMVKLLREKKGRRMEGEVTAIQKEGRKTLVGTLSKEKKSWLVVPDEKRHFRNISVACSKGISARDGDKVVVKIQRQDGASEFLQGSIVNVLGMPCDPGVDTAVILEKYSLTEDFSHRVIKETETLPGEEQVVAIAEEEKRTDLRHKLIITIDPADARDLDDAVSLEHLPSGNWLLGIHIADVSYYVKEGTRLHREAARRATSVYLADRVVHMLPPFLSQTLCSLEEGKDRLAVSVEAELNAGGEVLNFRFFPSLIRVSKRFSYKEAEKIINGEQIENISSSVTKMISEMNGLAKILKSRRWDNGALNLNLYETRLVLDKEGRPVAVEKKISGQAESLIEEFMLIANVLVARFLRREKLPAMYRVHPRPTAEKMEIFRSVIAVMGKKLSGDPAQINPRDLQQVLSEVSDSREEKIINYLLLRSLPHAYYSPVCEPHFGLAVKKYCHFTSPIRRFPDLVVHEVLKGRLSGKLLPEKIKKLAKKMPEWAENASRLERVAMEAERESIDMKKVQFMADKLGEIYTGIISGITHFALFVELENTIEGMIPVEDLPGYPYIYHERAMQLIGRTGQIFRIGDLLDVQVSRVSLENRKLYFSPVSKKN